MKSFPLTLIAISISIICILNIGLVSALNPDEVSVSPSWSTEIHYQGDSTFVTLILTSNCPEQLTIYYIGIHFDWMASDSFYGRDLSDDPVVVPSYEVQVFDPMIIKIPANVSAGSHSYFIGIDGAQGPLSAAFSWDSPSLTLQIQDSNSKIFNELLPQVANNMSRAINATYQSAEAQSLLDQAKNEYSQAIMSASEEKWAEALSSLQNASNYLEQAEAAEQLSAEQSAQQQQLLLYIAIIVIVVVVAAVIAVIWRKKRKMKPKAKQPPLKEDLTISSVAFSGGNTIDVVVDNSGTKDLVIAEVWINNEKQTFTITPAIEKIPPNESVHVSVTYAYSKGTNYHIKIVSDRKNFHLVSTTAV
jgi:hypothetical protein